MRSSRFAYSLLLSLMLPALLGYGFIKLKSYSLKHEVKQQLLTKLQPEDLVLLNFSHHDARTNIKWEHSSEFEYLGNMFDVVESYCSRDSVSFLCWPDHEDSKLNKILESFVSQSSNNDPFNQQTNQQVIDYYKSLFSIEFSCWENNRDGNLSLPSHYIFLYSNPVDQINDKPPSVNFLFV